jgi:hypothetical protein
MGIAVGSGGLAFYLAAFHSRTMKTQIHSTIFDIQVSGSAIHSDIAVFTHVLGWAARRVPVLRVEDRRRNKSCVQTFSIANGLSVDTLCACAWLCLSLTAFLFGPPGARGQGPPVGPGGRRGRIGVDLPGATPASCPLLAAPS